MSVYSSLERYVTDPLVQMADDPPRDEYRILFACDLHSHCVHRGALARLLRRLDDYKPTDICLGGDLVDCETISRFATRAGAPSLLVEVEWVKRIILAMRRHAPQARLHVAQGNHDLRLSEYLSKQAQGLEGLPGLTLPDLCGVAEAEWIPYQIPRIVGPLAFRHGARCSSIPGGSIRLETLGPYGMGVLARYIGMGHIHRRSEAVIRQSFGTVSLLEGGCMCDWKRMDYLHGVRPAWDVGWYEIVAKGRRTACHWRPGE